MKIEIRVRWTWMIEHRARTLVFLSRSAGSSAENLKVSKEP